MRIVYIVIRLIIDLISANRKLKTVIKLDNEGKVKERDKFIEEVTQWWAQRIFMFGKTKVEVMGSENVPQDGAVLFVGNHQSVMDIPLLLGHIDKQISFMAKIELIKVPIVAAWMKWMQCTFISRKDRKQSIQAMEESVQKLKNGYSQVIFPEGTRSKTGIMQEFKKGSFKLGFRAEVPIVPVTINGTWQMLDKKIGFEKAKVLLTIHPSIPTKGLTREQQAEVPEMVQKIVNSSLPEEHKMKDL